jgi:hypothetical protein
MDWQQAVSLCIVAATAVLLVGSRLRRRKFSFKSGNPCGCASAGTGISGESIVFRARKGARPEILVKLGKDNLPGSLR